MTTNVVEKFWKLVAQRHDFDAFAVLDGAYREPQRGYHDWSHIVDLLGKLDALSHLAARPDIVATAIFWHDSVYLTRDADGRPRADLENVRASAALFERHARFDAVEAGAVHEMIMATANHLSARASAEHYPGFAGDLDLFLDLDLSALAAPWPAFEGNLDEIRFEYSWAPENAFLIGRMKMLENFLAKGDALYRRPETRAMWLASARANLLRAEADIRGRLAHLPSSA